jgi:hypothetical protein
MKTIKSKNQNRKTRKAFNERPFRLFWESLSTRKIFDCYSKQGKIL